MPAAWGARSFNGTSDYVLNNTTPPITSGAFTAACWFNVAATQAIADSGLVENGNTAATGYWALEINGTSAPLKIGGNFHGAAAWTGSTITANTWQHGAVTFSGTNGINQAFVYLNGTGGTGNPSSVSPFNAAPGFQQVGAFGGGSSPNNFINGKIADVAIWNVVLSSSELLALAQGARPNTIRPANLKSYWPLDGLQSPEEDLSSSKYNGTLTGTTPAFGPPYAPFTPRWPQQARIFLPQDGNWGSRSFNGTSDKITLGNISAIAGTGARSFSAWVNPTSVTVAANPIIFGYGTASTADLACFAGIGQAVNGDFSLAFNLDNVHTTTTPVTVNVWQHLAWTFTGGTSNTTNIKLYYNGASQAAAHTGANSAPNTTNANFAIGVDRPDNAGFFPGRIGDVAVWNVALTATEVTALSQGARPNTIRPTSLQGWWPLDGLQSPEEDLSGFANNGTLTGTIPAFGPPYTPMTPRWQQDNNAIIPIVAGFKPQFALGKNIVIEGVAT